MIAAPEGSARSNRPKRDPYARASLVSGGEIVARGRAAICAYERIRQEVRVSPPGRRVCRTC